MAETHQSIGVDPAADHPATKQHKDRSDLPGDKDRLDKVEGLEVGVQTNRKDAREAYMRRIAQAARRTVGGVADAAELEQDRVRRLLEVFGPVIDRITLAATPDVAELAEHGTGPIDRALQGPAETAGLVLSQAIRDVAGDNEQLKRLLRGPVPATLDRMVQAGGRKPETIVDVAVSVLQAVPPVHPWVGDFTVQVIPHLRGFHETDPVKQHGWYQTIMSLASLLARVEIAAPFTQERLRGRAADYAGAYYHEVLWAVVTGTLADGDLSFIRGACNNLAAQFGRRLQRLSGGPDDEATETAHEIGKVLVKVNVVLSAEEYSAAAVDAFRPVIEPLGLDRLDVPVAPGDRHLLVVLDQVFNTATVALGDDDNLTGAFLHSVSGVVRATQRSHDRTAAAFFNAGIALLKATNRTDANQLTRREEAAWVRALLNLIGLRWALALNDDFAAALGPGDGGDCLVNLLGSLVSKGRVTIDQLWSNGLDDIVSITRAILAGRPIPGLDVARLDGLIEQFRRMRAVEPSPADPARLADAAGRLTDGLLTASGIDDKPADDKPAAVPFTAQSTAALVVRSFGHLADPEQPADQAFRSIVLPGVKNILAPYLTDLDDPIEILKRGYLTRSRSSKRQRDLALEAGPLVEVGLVTREEWDKIWAESRTQWDSMTSAFAAALG